MNDLTSVGSGAAVPAGTTSVPFDLPAALSESAWRSNFRWPVVHRVLRQRQMATVAAILDVAAGIADPRTRDLALLLQGHVGNIIRTIGELALLVEGAIRENVSFAGAPPELEYLAGRIALDGIKPVVLPRKRDQNISFAFGRRLARAASWTRSPWRLAKALIAPDHVAVSHNGLMQEFAARSADAISFQHSEPILQAGRALASPEGYGERVRDVLDRYEQVLGHCYPVAPATLTRMQAMYRQSAPAVAERAARDLDGLSRLPKLPRSLWVGSAGPYAARAIALEVRRRGGTTTGFDHGGSLSMMDDPYSIALRELAVNDRYVLPSTGAVAALAQTAALSLGQPFGKTQLLAGTGDPTFRFSPSLGGSGPKQHVYYIVTIFRALRQLVPTLLPDPIYLDWQLRLVEAMRQRGVDLVCKPHPEGILKGKRHPLEDVGQVEYRRFEEIRDGAAAFIYDYSQSTTFWEAVCTDCPIALIDFGITQFNTMVAPMIERRCRVIRARWDDGNLPSIDFDELAEAVTAKQSVDPSEFRMLLTGHG